MENVMQEEKMTPIDWLKAIGGALIAAPIIYGFMVVLLAMQP
jgi:hypothetical protein